jgi:Zinc carboxypeptidase
VTDIIFINLLKVRMTSTESKDIVFPPHKVVAAERATKYDTSTIGRTLDHVRYDTVVNEQSKFQNYELWEPHEISETLLRWAEHYPDLIRVTTAQEAYKLPTAGGKDDCPFDKNVDGCLNYIVTLQDFRAHPEGSDSSNRLPEVFWSGELHGDERVGPTAVLEAAQLLLDAATCEALPRNELLNGGTSEAVKYELESAEACRLELSESGINDIHRQWLARLITTRRIIMIPTANSLGYFRVHREENDIDPNRDFPYDLNDPRKCMRTIAGRTINEVYREHMFQLSLTFHGGMEEIGYEWGAPTWLGFFSPDDVAQGLIAGAYSRFAGAFKETPAYHYDPMNDAVYPVRGGMEDWAYAGSFDPERVVPCEPLTFSGYDKAKTIYSNSTLRVFNMLVETSDDKIPKTEDLGSSLGIMYSDGDGNGHVARNIRLALLAVELVEPYVQITKVNEVKLFDDIVPLTERGGKSCQTTKAVRVPRSSNEYVFEWTVGGALEINDVSLWYASWKDVEGSVDCLKQPLIENMNKYFRKAKIISSTIGATTFAGQEETARPFLASIDRTSLEDDDMIAVIASARVDQSWATMARNASPAGLPPQSHIVNVRTNPNWYHESNGYVIQGRLDWFSLPVTIFISSNNSLQETRPLVVSLRNQYMHPNNAENVVEGNETAIDVLSWMALLFILTSVGCCGYCLLKAYLAHRLRTTHRERVREFIHDRNAVSPGLKERQREHQDAYYDDREVELASYSIT